MTRLLSISAICYWLSAIAPQGAEVIPPADHRIDWRAAFSVFGTDGRVPSTNGWTHYTTLTKGTHTRADINTAIAAAPAYGIVRLAGGTVADPWAINGGDIRFTRSSVMLVGQGAWLKQIEWTNGNGQAAFTFNPNAFEAPPTYQRSWTAGYTKGDSNLTFSSVANLAVGKLVVLTQTTDNNDVQGIGDEGACDYCAGLLYNLSGSTNFVQQEQKRVTAINGSVVTISPPLMATNWAAAKNPTANYFSAATVTNCWIVDLGWTNRDSSIKYLVESMNAIDYGIKRCWSQRGKLAHFKTLNTLGAIVESSLFEDTFDSSTESYGIADYNTGVLVIDCAFNRVTGPRKGTSSTGSVFIHNYATNQPYANPSGSSSGTNWLIGSSSKHGSFCSYNLDEGNVLNSTYNDFIHGASGWNGHFRNRIRGWQFDRTANTFAFTLEFKNRYTWAIGNFFGQVGYHTGVDALYPSAVANDKFIYLIGYRDTDHDTGNGDAQTVSTFFRSHNRDTVTATNLVEGFGQMLGQGFLNSDTVPASMYWADKPDYFGNLPWPFRPSTNINELPAEYRLALMQLSGNAQDFFTGLVADRAIVQAGQGRAVGRKLRTQ